ncbi:SDR family NAD(P)-dependent oxidoreductase [Microbacterium sp.]|uniref:SDR family NAD(P)-dependent oxidoreductase n=1 Tax=Microbacterium sp. TaxID=51671 RepID=UPI00092A8269|nr:SDR family oxidoreductase [Microbacterium sp.]MBN9187995.1 SDR family oxidoreductase [Microbacterium sp.]MBN9194249.1 SDR family oxidoreductase [Microbacterium sp.]OJU62573.1 MAG: short-chain dehydrogenase [Microbacterium sp. 70-38]
MTDLVAIVTGGASGIGARTVAVLRRRGVEAIVLDRETAAVPTGTPAIMCDVTDDRAIAAAIDAVIERFGRLDIVVNNAGIGATGDVATNPIAEWQRVFDVNVFSMARVAAAALPHLRRSPSAAIVNLSSAVALVGVTQRALYSASKGAVTALTLAMAADHIAEGIRVNAVAPGTTETPWVGRLLDQADDRDRAAASLRARQPLGRLVRADEVAAAVAYLALPEAGSTTGTILQVDGGMGSLRL